MNALAEKLEAQGLAVEDGPIPIARPGDEDGLREVLARAAEDGARVVPCGNGGRLAWCRPEVLDGDADLLLSTAALDAVLDYVPGDGTLTAQAGCTMAQLERAVAAGGHVLTPRVPRAEQATLGGTLGAGHSGLDRTRYGPARHHVLGVRAMLADGTSARSGGKLVKNVTGFDLHRLYTGSRGTLCILLEASLRLFPRPEREVVLTWEHADDASTVAATRALRRLPLNPLEHVLEKDARGARTHVTLAGLDAQVEAERRLVVGAVGEPDALHDHEAASLERARLRDLEAADGWPQFALGARPDRLGELLPRIGNDGVTRALILPSVLSVLAWVPDHAGAAASAGGLAGFVKVHGAARTRLVPRAVDAATHSTYAPRRGSEPALRWMLALRDALDPDGRFRSPLFPGRP